MQTVIIKNIAEDLGEKGILTFFSSPYNSVGLIPWGWILL